MVNYVKSINKKYLILSLSIFIKVLIGTNVYAEERPNIIFIMTDDQSPFPIELATTTQARPFGYCGDTHVYTPRIDSLARNGMIFTQAHVSTSVCAASRYSILTGRYAGRCKATNFMELHPLGNMTRVENNVELEEVSERNNLAFLLQKAGYKTGFVGKSHIVDHYLLNKNNWTVNGLQLYDQDADPQIPEVNQAMSHNHNYWVNRIKEFGFDYVNAVYSANLKELYNDAVYVHNLEYKNKAALEFIENSGTEPFFLYYSENIPHGPTPWKKNDGLYEHGLDANEKYSAEGYSDYDYSFMPDRQSIKDEVNNMEGKDMNHAWLTWFDYAVGSVIDKLKEVGKLDNTVIVITSDHGHYNHGKATIYEGGVRVPLLFFWPIGIQAGSVYEELVQNIDFAPTFLDLAGITVDEQSDMDGKSFKNVLNGSMEPIHEHLFFEMGYARGITTKKWKYITVRYDEATEEKICKGETFNGYEGRILNAPYYLRNKHLGHFAAINNPHYFERNQLYNLENDPWEENNIFDTEAAKAQEMSNVLQNYLALFPDRPYGNLTYNCNATSLDYNFKASIMAYPTTPRNILMIKGAGEGSEYAIYNMYGTKVAQNIMTHSNIDVTRLKKGIYILSIEDEFIRFIKE